MDSNEEFGELEEKLNNAFKDLEITSFQEFLSQTKLLNSIKKKDPETYTHLIRVSLLGKNIGELINSYNIINFRISDFFLACLLHDIGKLYSKPESLGKIGGFNKEDMEDIKKHPLDGYKLLKGLSIIHNEKTLDFISEIILRHHKYKIKDPYPENIAEFEQNISKKSKGVFELYSRALSIADFDDSLKNRKNNKYAKENFLGNLKLPNSKKAKKILLDNFPEDADFIEEMYKKGIFE